MHRYKTRPGDDRNDIRRRGLRSTKTPAAVRPVDAFYGDFDGQVRTIKDRGSGTKFYVDSGDVRGPWCPAILPKRPSLEGAALPSSPTKTHSRPLARRRRAPRT